MQSRIDAEALPVAARLYGTLMWLSGKPAAARRWWQRALSASGKLEARHELGTDVA